MQRDCIGKTMLDLQKAFATVDHSILLKKFECMRVVSIDWLKSYLADRQEVFYNYGVT